MKSKSVIYFLLLVLTACDSQDFEGVITWSVKTSYDDPGIEAKAKETLKNLTDLTGNAPVNELKIKIKDGNSLVDMRGVTVSPNEPVYLFLKEKNQLLMVSPDEKVYRNVSSSLQDKNEIIITKTSESRKILGYTCVKTIVTSESMEQIFWTTDEIKNFDLKCLTFQSVLPGHLKETMFYEDIGGVPLRIELKATFSGRIFEVKEIKSQELQNSDFVIPADWREIKLNKN